MQETPQQYTERMLNHSRGKEPLRLQQATPRKLTALVKGLSKKQLTRRPAPGKWSIAEILAHLADAELVVGFRLRLMLASNGTPIQAFDQDAWAETFSYNRRDPRVSIETFNTLNHFNPNNPNSGLTLQFATGANTNAAFGTIQGAQVQARRVALSARFKF